jgi:hypothetical protein
MAFHELFAGWRGNGSRFRNSATLFRQDGNEIFQDRFVDLKPWKPFGSRDEETP